MKNQGMNDWLRIVQVLHTKKKNVATPSAAHRFCVGRIKYNYICLFFHHMLHEQPFVSYIIQPSSS